MKQRNLVLGLAMAALSTTAVAAPPDTEAVEFYNLSTNHYFVTSSGAEAGMIDAGAAGQGWVRTGRSFQAWSEKSGAPASARAVCRFYSYIANSHFYAAEGGECDALRAGDSGWIYEGIGFHVQTPVDGQCPEGTVPMVRVYNNGYATGEGSNHRFVDDSALQELMNESDWVTEGVAFCTVPKHSGTNASLGPTATSFEVLEGEWAGLAKWEVEVGEEETEVRRPLELAFTADGAITGSGYGCTFTGEAAFGDGFRSFFMGTVTATGCTDPAFNGEYPRLKLQRFGNGTLMVKLKKGDEENEVSVMGNLSIGAVDVPPPGPPTSGYAGDWTGTVRFQAEGPDGSDEDTEEDEVHVNKTLDLSITVAGDITGSGYGCAFTGTVGGEVLAAGCEDPLFNGTYESKVKPEHRGMLRIEFERETAEGEAKIKGTLVAAPAEEA